MKKKHRPRSCGTWDFTEDADELLKRSGEAYVLVTSNDGSPISRIRLGMITTLAGVEWFRARINAALDEHAEDIRKAGGG